jgi:hypothetical protein
MLKSLRRIHEDERGMESLQTIVIMAVAALILVVVVKLWPNIKNWFTSAVNAVTTGFQG